MAYYYKKSIDINSNNIKAIKSQISKSLKKKLYLKSQREEFKMILQTYRTMHKNYDNIDKCFLHLSNLSYDAIFYLYKNKDKETSKQDLFDALDLTIPLGVQTVVYDLANKKLIELLPIDLKLEDGEQIPLNDFLIKISNKGIEMVEKVKSVLSHIDISL
jgi:hypothetical protein